MIGNKMKFVFFASILASSLSVSLAMSETIDEYCLVSGDSRPLRQTVVVVDGTMIVPDSADGPAEGNQRWRSFVRMLVDAEDRQISQIMAPHEQITIAVANSDGSGLSIVFSGCIPMLTPAEIVVAEEQTNAWSKWIATDWRSKLEAFQERFRRSATIATISGIKNVPIGPNDNGAVFRESSLIASLRRSPGFNDRDGLVRYIILTDFANAKLPLSDVVTARRTGREDGVSSGVDFNESDIYIFADGAGSEQSKQNYLEAFLLASGGELIALGSVSSTITDNRVPISKRVFQGTADFPRIGEVPVRMRLATDANNRVVMSWFEEQRRSAAAIPIRGAITCDEVGVCHFQGDQVFAHIWSDNPNQDPECAPDMPMAGMRNLDFKIEGGTITGAVTDIKCIIIDREETGLTFELRELRNDN